MKDKKLLMVVTNAKVLHLTDGTEHPSGYWAEEVATPYTLFTEAGYHVDVATIDGVVPHVDASSLDPDNIKWVVPQDAKVDFGKEVERYRAVLASIPGLSAPLDLGKITAGELARYQGIFIAGGHGCMTDMPNAHGLARLLLRAQERSMLIGAVCHGQSALLAPRDATGRNPFRGYRFTCFSQQEESLVPIWGRLPMVIQYELEGHGLVYEKADAPWGSKVVRDRNLVTGQNPFSSAAVSRAVVEALAAR